MMHIEIEKAAMCLMRPMRPLKKRVHMIICVKPAKMIDAKTNGNSFSEGSHRSHRAHGIARRLGSHHADILWSRRRDLGDKK